MINTIKRVSLSLTKEDLRQLQELKKFFGTSNCEVFRKALSRMYSEYEPLQPKIYRGNTKNKY